MQIPFNLPHAFPYSGYSQEENKRVRGLVRDCVTRLNLGNDMNGTLSKLLNFGSVPFSRRSKSATVEFLPSRKMVIFDIPFAFYPNASDENNANALSELLTCLTASDRVFREFHPNYPPLYSSGVYYNRTTVWDSLPALYERGFGDCKSLTAARVAELDPSIARPVFRFSPRTDGSGEKDFHILVQRSDIGDPPFEDPSKALGMTDDERRYF